MSRRNACVDVLALLRETRRVQRFGAGVDQ